MKLDNGLRIVMHRMPRMQSAALGIWIGVGGRYESKQNKGISHFLEHILFKGSSKYNYRQIKELIEGKGGSLNGFTSEEITCYLCKVLPKNLSLGLDILSDMVLNPTMPEAEVEKERLVILEEIKMYKDLPQYHVHELLDALLWPEHPLGINLAGTFESVSGIKKENLLNFQQKNYHPSNIVIAVSGVFDKQEVLSKVTDIFSKIPQKDIPNFVAANKPLKKPELSCLFKETEQTHLAMGIPALKRKHKDRHALGLLHVVLGANMSSRLFNKVREEKGLCYAINTQVKNFYDSGAFFVNAGMDNRKVKEAIEVIVGELEKIKNEQVTDDELERAKEFYIGQLAMALEETLDHMFWIGEPTICEGRTYTFKEIIRKVNRLNRDDLRRVASNIFDLSKLKIALIGPLKEQEQESIRNLITFA